MAIDWRESCTFPALRHNMLSFHPFATRVHLISHAHLASIVAMKKKTWGERNTEKSEGKEQDGKGGGEGIRTQIQIRILLGAVSS